MSETEDKAFLWGTNHYCGPDATELYNTEPQRLNDPALGYPQELENLPETFCSVCLGWFTGTHTEGSDHRPPQKGTA